MHKFNLISLNLLVDYNNYWYFANKKYFNNSFISSIFLQCIFSGVYAAFSEPPIYLSSFFWLLCVIVAWWLFGYSFISNSFPVLITLIFTLLLAQFRWVPLSAVVVVVVGAVIFDLIRKTMPLLLAWGF